MKRVLIYLLLFLFMGCSITGGAVLLTNSSYSDNIGGGKSPNLENDVTQNAPTNDDLWTDGHYADSFAGGSGTSSDPYLIGTSAQLARLAYLVNTSSTNSQYSELYYRQTANLDMSEFWWDAIGTLQNEFTGCYDGGEYTISGLYTNENEEQYQGLFGYFYVSGSTVSYRTDEKYIKNVNIINSHIQGKGSSNNYSYTGGILGYAYTSYNASIEISNCSYSGIITASGYYIGGIVGGSYVDEFYLFDCKSSGTINALDARYVGGIIGYTDDSYYKPTSDHYAEIYNCSNMSNINAYYCVGGIIGQHNWGSVHDCYNLGNIEISSMHAGGIIGQAYYNSNSQDDDLYNCYNEGNITATFSQIGGIISQDNYFRRIYNCYNTGNIQASSGTSGGSLGIAGGIVGFTGCDRLFNCYNKGEITGCGNIGGIIGEMVSVEVLNNVNTGFLSLAQNNDNYIIGSIVGYISAQRAIVRNCYYGVNCDITSVVGDYYGSQTISNNSTCSLSNVTSESWYTTSSNWYFSQPWDFEETWSIIPGINDGYPILNGMLSIMSFTITWNGNGSAGALLPSSYWNYAGSSGYTSSNTGNNSSYTASTTAVKATSAVNYGSTLSYKTPIPIRSGYTFNGWYTATSGGLRVADNAGNLVANVSGYTNSSREWVKAENVTLYAQWTAKTYSITYNLNSGSLSSRPTSYSVASNQTIGTPTMTGYTFKGWTVQMKLDKLYNGQIDQHTGIQSYNSAYPNAVYYEMFYMSDGVSYTAATSGGQVRYRAFASNGVYSRSSGAVTLTGSNEYAFLWYHLGNSNAQTTVSFSSSSSFTTSNYKLVGDLVLTANFTPITYTIKLNKNGGNGGANGPIYVKYATGWYSNSGATSAISSVTIPSRSGFTFNGYYTATSGGTRIIDSAGKIVASNTFTTSNRSLYAQWVARNPAYYDEAGDYWYIENGKMPQSKVTGSLKTTLNSQWSTLSNGSTYYMGAISSLASKIYNGNEYCKYNNEFYLVEPIRWRLTSSSSQKTGYGTTTDTLAVMAEVVYVGRYSTSEINAGSGYQTISVNNYMMKNQIDNTYLVNWTQSMPTFGTTSINGAVQNVTSRMFVSSVDEINTVAGSGKVKFSDLVKDYLKSTGNGMLYYTRDLGTNYNNIICLNENGDRTQRKPNLTANRLGVQFTIKVTEYACVEG